MTTGFAPSGMPFGSAWRGRIGAAATVGGARFRTPVARCSGAGVKDYDTDADQQEDRDEVSDADRRCASSRATRLNDAESSNEAKKDHGPILADHHPFPDVRADRMMVYGTGDFAYGRYRSAASYSYDFDGLFSGSGSVSQSGTSTGWTIGAGTEYAVTGHATLKGGYLLPILARARSMATISAVSPTPPSETRWPFTPSVSA